MKQSVANSKIMLREKCCEIPKIIICLQEDIIINVKCSCEKKDKTLDAFLKENVKDVNTYKTEGKCCLMDENDNSSSHFNNVKFCIQCGKWFCDNCQKNHNSIIDKDCAIMYDWKMNLHDDNNNAAKPYKLPHLFQNYRLNYNQQTGEQLNWLLIYNAIKHDLKDYSEKRELALFKKYHIKYGDKQY